MSKPQQSRHKSSAHAVRKQGQRTTRRLTITELRVKDLRRLAQHRCAFAVESPASILLLEILAQHLALLPGDPRKRIAQLLDHEARWYGIERFDDLLDRIKEGPKWWKAPALGWHLRLTEHERTICKIVTIEAAGVSPEQRKAINLEKRRAKYAKAREEAGRKPRAEWLAEHTAKPWIAAGMSRRTWYRKRVAQVFAD